jgi:Dyp-type peroxidase family
MRRESDIQGGATPFVAPQVGETRPTLKSVAERPSLEGRSVELDDVQGLVRFGYKHLTEACFLLLRVKDPAAARAWLMQVPVASAVKADPLPETALQIALTSEGLRALEVAPELCEEFSTEFVAGMASDAARARRLGDIGANDPSGWKWGTGERVPHVALLLYARSGRLAAWQQEIEAQCAAGFERIEQLSTSELKPEEPFGFADGISQPEVDWERERPVRDQDQLEYLNVSCLGEFLLGYPNEYGLYTPRPLLDPQRDPGALLPRAEDAPDQADLGRNGCYLVLRQLRQDVEGFWQELDSQAGGDPELREWLAAKMVGRKKDGEPLVAPTGALAAGGSMSRSKLNDFTYEADPQGLRCPLGAHIRRANPRNADLPPGARGIFSRLTRMLGFNAAAREQDLIASTRFHRLLRRGRTYGVGATAGPSATESSASTETGLHFICLAANIKRQFEFVQSAWLMGSKFAGLTESDPLLGHRLPDLGDSRTDYFSIPQADGPDRRLNDLPQFVTVLGGAYFFLPGIRALRYLATAGGKGS